MSAKKYNITVNGSLYEVLVEEAGSVASAPVTVSAPAPTPVAAPAAAPAPVAAPVAPAPSSQPGAGNEIKAPLNGTILSVTVKVGDVIKSGDVLCILEAMKMENEIMAPSDGKVTSVITQKGVSVNVGDLLFTIQ